MREGEEKLQLSYIKKSSNCYAHQIRCIGLRQRRDLLLLRLPVLKKGMEMSKYNSALFYKIKSTSMNIYKQDHDPCLVAGCTGAVTIVSPSNLNIYKEDVSKGGVKPHSQLFNPALKTDHHHTWSLGNIKVDVSFRRIP